MAWEHSKASTGAKTLANTQAAKEAEQQGHKLEVLGTQQSKKITNALKKKF